MTDDDVKAMLARADAVKLLDKATPPGPWVANHGRVKDGDDDTRSVIVDGPDGQPVCWVYWNPHRAARANFIAAARLLLPALANDVRTLAAERDAALARVAALEAALRPFAERSEGCRHAADAVAGIGAPSRLQPVPLEWLIRAAALLVGKEGA